MWIWISKQSARVGSQILRQVSNFADDLGEGLIEAKKRFLNDQDRKTNVRSLRIAILGLPNVGKSTLVNHLIGRPICATSSKVHTTRRKAAAIYCTDDTQLIFIDTPGLVRKGDFKRFKLEDNFKYDTQKSMEEADVVGVVQDMTDVRARESINGQIIDLLNLSKAETTSVLILNKVDALKNKRVLLKVVDRLTKAENSPAFSDVFMISALTGDGVSDLRNYFLDSAKDRNWDFDKTAYTDQPAEVIVKQMVKASVLEDLPQEIPYIVDVIVEHIEYCNDDSMNIVVNLNCPSVRVARMVIGRTGERIKKVAKEAEQALSAAFRTSVRLKVAVPIKDEPVVKKRYSNQNQRAIM